MVVVKEMEKTGCWAEVEGGLPHVPVEGVLQASTSCHPAIPLLGTQCLLLKQLTQKAQGGLGALGKRTAASLLGT